MKYVWSLKSILYRFIAAMTIAVFAINLIPAKPVHALACTAIASGDWSMAGTWSCGVVPGIGDTVTIGTPFVVTLTANQSATNVTINTGGTLALAAFTLTLDSASSGMIVNNGGILNAGTGIVNDNAAGGAPFTLAAGATLQTGNAFGIVTGVALTGSIQTRGLRTYTAGADYVYNGAVNQAVGNGLTQNTPRNLTINNPGNTVSLGVATTISGSLIMTAGTLSLAANTIVGDVQGTANITKNIAGAATLTTGSNNASTTYSGIISNGIGTVALTKVGTGILTLSGANTYSGTTTLTLGTININSATAIGSGAFTITAGTINNTSGAAITLSNNNLINWNGNFTFTGTNALNLGTGAVTLSANRTVTVTASTLTVGGVIGGAFRLTKAGNGALTLNGVNTHSGTTLTAGRINIGNAQALGNVASVINLNGGSIDNTTGAALTLPNYAYSIGGNITFAGTNNLNLGTNTVTLTGNRTITVTANTLTVDGIIGGAFRLTKAGNGNLTLNGVNTHSGITLTAGRLNIGNAQALGNAASVINLNGGSIDNTTGAALTLPNNPYSIGGNVTFVGTNNLNLGTGAVTLTGNRTITVTANTLTVDGIVGGAFRLTKAGAGNLTLNGVNTHSGTTLTAGRLNIGNAQALGNAASVINLNGGSIDNITGAALTLPNNPYSIGGNVTFAGTNNLNLGIGAVTLTGNRTITVTANTLTVGGIVGGAFRLTKAGNGALTLNGANTHSGTTLTAGRLNIGNAQAPGNVASTFIINGGSIDNISGAAITTLNYPQTWGGNFTFIGTNALNLGTGAVTLSASRTVTVNANTLTVGGTISPNTVDLTKLGAGMLSFGANAVNLRNIIISAGTLVSTSGSMNLAGNFTNNSVFTNNSGTVNFNGVVAQSITGATIFNNLTLNNVNGLTINASETVNGILTFTNGRINTGVNVLIVGTGGSIVGAAAGRYVNGFLQKNFVVAAGQSFAFPVGNAAAYAPINLANLNVTTTGGIIASTTAGEHPSIATSGISSALDVNRYWTLAPAGGIAITAYDATFNFVPADVDGGANTNNFFVQEFSGGSWSTPTTVSPNPTNIQATGLTVLGSFAVGESGNIPPVITSDGGGATANINVFENTTAVTTVTATDASLPVQTLTYSITGGADFALFGIVGGSGVLTFNSAPDFETPADFGGNNLYDVTVQVSDGNGGIDTQDISIAVSSVNEAPTDIALSNNTINENQPVNTVVGVLSATDPDAGATYTFALACTVAGANDGSFNISGTNLQSSASFDFETQSVYNICVRVTDQGGLTYDENFVVNVNNVNEDPTDIALSNNTVDENLPANTVVGILSATDPDAGATFTFTLTCTTAGADDGSFNIAGANLQTSASFDFETQNVYNICIRVTDQGGLTYDENFVVNVNNVNDAPTDMAVSNSSIAENNAVNAVIGVLTATDPDAGATFTFTLTCTVAGADDGSFNIAGTNLRASASFDFETQNVYNICIRVTDQGGLTYDENFVVNVNNVNEGPTDIVLSNNTVDENLPANTIIGALTASDPDAGATFTFTLTCTVAGADDGSFNIAGTNLRASASFDFETQNVYNICIQVTDQGGLTYDENFVVNVNNVNDAPTDIALSNNTVNENLPANTLVGALSAVDPDAGATFTFDFTCAVSGADDGSFNISGTNLQTSASFDFETQAAYNICIRVTDQGGLAYDESFTVDVLNVNEAPTDIALSNNVVAENNAINVVIGALSATDVDGGETFIFSLSCAIAGADDGSFNINAANLRASIVFDYETQNSFSVCIRVTDSGNNTFDENFTITITDLDEIRPAVTIDQAIGQVDPTNTTPINFTVVFSEPILGFIATDIALSGTALPTTAVVIEIAPNDGTTYNVAVSGMTSSGTVIASLNAGVVTDTAGNGNTASTSTDNIVNFDPSYPVVLFNADTTPANASTLTVGPIQITIAYNEDVKNDGSAGAANNIVNYLLVEAGVDLTFDTLSCLAGLVADDVQITIDSATYTNNGGGGPFVATLNINGGTPLPVGNYRLFICGTTSIEDLANNELNNGLSDTTLNFIVTVLNTLPSTGFPMNEVTSIPHQPADLKYASYSDLWLEIPKLNLKLSIVGVPLKNGGWDVTWLNRDAGWLNGSAFPTWNGNSVITGHVWDALNKPGPFAELKKLKYGDQIKVHAFGQVYIYEIRESKLISSSNKTSAFKHEENSWITLITCEDYKEQAKKYLYRRMLRAVLISVAPEK